MAAVPDRGRGDSPRALQRGRPGLGGRGRRLGRSTARRRLPEEALAAVVGYSAFNDLTSRRAQKLTSQWTLGKNGDRSGPIGPIVPAAEVGDLRQGLRLRTRVNGETMQDATTDQMIYPVGETLSLVSHTLTLRPGDLLATGTPAGVGYGRKPPRLLQPGDTVEVEVERLGVVRNTVVGDDRRTAGRLPRPSPAVRRDRRRAFRTAVTPPGGPDRSRGLRPTVRTPHAPPPPG
ncbi:hypothetical protein GCM10020295_77830 [Streptomyces cinereospinus]